MIHGDCACISLSIEKKTKEKISRSLCVHSAICTHIRTCMAAREHMNAYMYRRTLQLLFSSSRPQHLACAARLQLHNMTKWHRWAPKLPPTTFDQTSKAISYKIGLLIGNGHPLPHWPIATSALEGIHGWAALDGK